MFHRAGTAPLLTRADVPDLPPAFVDVSSVFNPGAVRLGQTSLLLCRVQSRGRRTVTWLATGQDERHFTFRPEPLVFAGLERLDQSLGTVFHNYDARVSLCEDRLVVVSALDTEQGCRLAVWTPPSADEPRAGFSALDLVGLTGDHDTRNGVLFPRRVGGRYLLLERPNTTRLPGGPTSGDGVRLLSSADLAEWQDEGPVFGGRPHYWDELVGSGPPPVETEAGWLHIYHGVATHFGSANIYQAGAIVLDRDDPTRVLARTQDNLLEPREPWELTGQVPNVVFPSGLIVNGPEAGQPATRDAVLNLYYGAADTAIGLATATVGDILDACR